MSLLHETLGCLMENGKRPEDVRFVGVLDMRATWAQFADAARGLEYDSGYGRQEITPTLVIAGDGWWMERGEYDGSEWWEFKTRPTRPGKCWFALAEDHLRGRG